MTPLILTLLFVVVVAISALVGFVRGLNKSVIRIMTLVLAIILTFVIAGPVTTLVAESIVIEGQTLGEMILEAASSTEMVAEILEAAPLMQEAILVAPAFVMAIVIFPAAFFLLSFVSWIVFLCVQKPLRKLIFKDSCKKEDAKKAPMGVRIGKKFAGLGIGVVTGALIFGMIMAPVFGLLSVLPEKSAIDEVLDAMVEQGSLEADDAEYIKGEYAVTDSALVKFYGIIGATPAGKAYLNSVSKIEADGQTTYLTDEFDTLLAVAQTAIEGGLLEALNNSENQDALYAVLADKEFVNALMQDMFNSKLLRSAVPEVMAFAMESVARSLKVPENKEEVYNNMMDDIATAVKDADVDYDGIKAYEDAMGISYIDSVDGVSPREGLMTEEEYNAEIEKLNALTTKISSILSKNVSGGNETLVNSIADNIVKDVKKQASENGAEAVKNFDANTVKTTISSISSSDVEAGEGSADEFLGKLTNPEKFETNVATVETIKESIRETVKTAVSDDSKSKETASTLASVVSDFAGAVSTATDENGNIDATKLDFEKVASAVTSLQGSTLKGVGSSVLDIVASGDLGGNDMISDAIGTLKDGYENGEEVGGAIGSAGALAGLLGAENEDDKVTAITNLINNLNEFTINSLPSILSASTLESMGVPAEYTEAT
ncbi:MAG: CvpA family protein, partial [Clostridia bacterium]|nr:CvpA family protein [Clostridia bacterium]